MVEGTKISKSLGNGVLLSELAKLGYNALDVRMLLLQSHYRTQANFTMNGLAAARQRRQSLQAFSDLRFQTTLAGGIDDLAFHETQRIIREELNRDLHTPEALAALSDLASATETELVSHDSKQSIEDFIAFIDRVFGLKLSESTDITDEQKHQIHERETARANKDFAEADRLRNELAAQKIELRDTPVGTVWYRTL